MAGWLTLWLSSGTAVFGGGNAGREEGDMYSDSSSLSDTSSAARDFRAGSGLCTDRNRSDYILLQCVYVIRHIG